MLRKTKENILKTRKENDSDFIIQPSPYKRTEINLLEDEKGRQHLGQVVVWIVHLLV